MRNPLVVEDVEVSGSEMVALLIGVVPLSSVAPNTIILVVPLTKELAVVEVVFLRLKEVLVAKLTLELKIIPALPAILHGDLFCLH